MAILIAFAVYFAIALPLASIIGRYIKEKS